MNDQSPQSDELGQLLAALCDGEISPAEAARLEELAAGSSEARRRFLHYVQLSAELHWAAGEGGIPDTVPPAVAKPVPAPRFLRAPVRWLSQAGAISLALTALAAGLLVVAAAWWLVPGTQPAPGPGGAVSLCVARLARTHGVEWSAAGPVRADRAELPADTMLDLHAGLAEIAFAGGAQVVLQGPARFEVESASSGRLERGRLHASVPHEAVGFAVNTPGGSVVDLGTEFGVSVDGTGQCEVHVFSGSVKIVSVGSATTAEPTLRVGAGRAVRLRPTAPGAPPQIEDSPPDPSAFVRDLPSAELPAGAVAALRALVEAHPSLLHHYTFEGATPGERRRDRHGSLHLIETVMSGGRAGGDLAFPEGPLARGDRVLQPFRGTYAGNTVGAALQSEGVFQPPSTMTVELLVNFAGLGLREEGAVGAAVATRASGRDCGFFVVAVGSGELAYLFDGDESWGGCDDPLIPGEWYYVASTFEADPKTHTTKVNTYFANVTRGENVLQWVVQDVVSRGTPAASRLGIGKGFDRQLSHAYPWPGMLDEIAIYGAVLDETTLGGHLKSLTGKVD